MKEPTLTNKDHEKLDAFLGAVLDAYKNGELTKASATGNLAHVFAAIDRDNYTEVYSWLENGAEFIRDGE